MSEGKTPNETEALFIKYMMTQTELSKDIAHLLKDQVLPTLDVLSKGIMDLYKYTSVSWNLLLEIAENRLILLKSVIPSEFHIEMKSKIKDLEKEYAMLSKSIDRLNNVWKELFKSKNDVERLILLGRFQEILENQVGPHKEKFFELASKIWKEYLEWRKNIEKSSN